MYDTAISHTVLSQIADRIIPDVKACQNRPLEPLYCIVWLDAMHYKVKVDGKIDHKALYNILGINKEGRKEILGMYISESEGANLHNSRTCSVNGHFKGQSDLYLFHLFKLKSKKSNHSDKRNLSFVRPRNTNTEIIYL